MAKNKVSEWSSTASSNIDVGNIDINEGCSPSNLNNAIREVMAQIKDMQTGADSDPLVVGGNLSVTGTSTLTGATTVSGVLTASGGVTGNVTGNITGNQSGGSVSATTGTFSGQVAFNGNVASSFIIDNRSSTDGGAFLLEKASSSTLAADIIIDTNQQSFRFFENGGTNRGASLDLTTCAASAGSVIVTSSNISTYAPAPLTRATAQNSTSGTFIDFTSIPSTVKRITIMFQGVSTNGSSRTIIRLGTSSGIVSTGYLSSAGYIANSSSGFTSSSTIGFLTDSYGGASDIRHGSLVLTNISSNSWVYSSVMALSSSTLISQSAGSTSLSGLLTQLRITTENGTDTFDAGTINIMYE